MYAGTNMIHHVPTNLPTTCRISKTWGCRSKTHDGTICCKFSAHLHQLDPNKNYKLCCYLQSHKYFWHVKYEIKREFTFGAVVRERAQARILNAHLENERKRNRTDATAEIECVFVGLHARLGDFGDWADPFKNAWVTCPRCLPTCPIFISGTPTCIISRWYPFWVPTTYIISSSHLYNLYKWDSHLYLQLYKWELLI